METNKDNKKEAEKSMPIKKSKNIYKKPWFWLLLIFAAIGTGLLIFAGIYLSAQSKNKQVISDGWFTIYEKNKSLSELGQKVDSQETFDSYKEELKKLNSSVDEKKYAAQKLSYKARDTKLYENFINEYSVYTSRSVELANKIDEYTEENNEKLIILSTNAKNSAEEFKNNVKYVKDSLPQTSFEIQNILSEGNKIVLANQLSIKAKQLAEQAATAKDLADKKLVENTAGNFLNAFLAGNAPQMRQYMTEAYQKEYDFNQLTAESRKTTYPASFRIINNQKIEDGKYRVQANVLFKFRDGSSQFTVGYEMNVIYDTNQSKWLINSIKEGSSL